MQLFMIIFWLQDLNLPNKTTLIMPLPCNNVLIVGNHIFYYGSSLLEPQTLRGWSRESLGKTGYRNYMT